jgi:hypothetical protein
LSFGQDVRKQVAPGQFEYTAVPATLKKLPQGKLATLPEAEAKALIRRGIATRPEEATDQQLIMAGLKAPAVEEDDSGDDD